MRRSHLLFNLCRADPYWIESRDFSFVFFIAMTSYAIASRQERFCPAPYVLYRIGHHQIPPRRAN
jgi:hypothetical protein